MRLFRASKLHDRKNTDQREKHDHRDRRSDYKLPYGVPLHFNACPKCREINGNTQESAVDIRVEQERNRSHYAAGVTAGFEMKDLAEYKNTQSREKINKIHEPKRKRCVQKYIYDTTEKITRNREPHSEISLPLSALVPEMRNDGLQGIRQNRKDRNKKHCEAVRKRATENLGAKQEKCGQHCESHNGRDSQNSDYFRQVFHSKYISFYLIQHLKVFFSFECSIDNYIVSILYHVASPLAIVFRNFFKKNYEFFVNSQKSRDLSPPFSDYIGRRSSSHCKRRKKHGM